MGNIPQSMLLDTVCFSGSRKVRKTSVYIYQQPFEYKITELFSYKILPDLRI